MRSLADLLVRYLWRDPDPLWRRFSGQTQRRWWRRPIGIFAILLPLPVAWYGVFRALRKANLALGGSGLIWSSNPQSDYLQSVLLPFAGSLLNSIISSFVLVALASRIQIALLGGPRFVHDIRATGLTKSEVGHLLFWGSMRWLYLPWLGATLLWGAIGLAGVGFWLSVYEPAVVTDVLRSFLGMSSQGSLWHGTVGYTSLFVLILPVESFLIGACCFWDRHLPATRLSSALAVSAVFLPATPALVLASLDPNWIPFLSACYFMVAVAWAWIDLCKSRHRAITVAFLCAGLILIFPHYCGLLLSGIGRVLPLNLDPLAVLPLLLFQARVIRWCYLDFLDHWDAKWVAQYEKRI